MGTHPIFESDFDCLTGTSVPMGRTLWYHSTLGRNDADSLLAGQVPGSYLVRKSDSDNKSPSYRLSVVNDDLRINHFPIEIKYGLVMLGSQPFSSLEAVISHFSST